MRKRIKIRKKLYAGLNGGAQEGQIAIECLLAGGIRKGKGARGDNRRKRRNSRTYSSKVVLYPFLCKKQKGLIRRGRGEVRWKGFGARKMEPGKNWTPKVGTRIIEGREQGLNQNSLAPPYGKPSTLELGGEQLVGGARKLVAARIERRAKEKGSKGGI